MAIVYCATNLTNGKMYVGVTVRTLTVRMREHKSQALSGSVNTFHTALRKYGWKSFTWKILESDIPCDILASREVWWVNHMGTKCVGRGGYNRTDGGGGTVGMEVSESTRRLLSRKTKDRVFKKYGLKKQVSLFHNRMGVPVTDETRQKMSASSKLTPLGTVPSKLHHSLWPMIRSLREFGFSYRRLGEIYEVRPETVFYFCKRRELRPA